MGVSENQGYCGTLLWGPYNKDSTNYGTLLGYPVFGNSHMVYVCRECQGLLSLGEEDNSEKEFS